MAETSDIPPSADNPEAALREDVNRLRSELITLTAELSALRDYVRGFKGDGSGVEFKANVASLRLPRPPAETGDGGTSSQIAILEEGEEITDSVASIDFVGDTITAEAAGDDVTVTIHELIFRVVVGGAATNVIMPAVLEE